MIVCNSLFMLLGVQSKMFPENYVAVTVKVTVQLRALSKGTVKSFQQYLRKRWKRGDIMSLAGKY